MQPKDLLVSIGKTYSFSPDNTAAIFTGFAEILAGMGLSITKSEDLKTGFEKLFNIEYINLPNLNTKSYIIAPNHVSDFDALILGLLHCQIKVMAKKEWVENPQLMQFLSLHYDLVGIDRTSKMSQARALVSFIKYLATPGVHHILTFPQGTISNINNNGVGRIQNGVFTMAARANVPVLPVFIEQPSLETATRIVFGGPMPIPAEGEDCRLAWQESIIALQNSLMPPARRPVLSEKHANNNNPGDKYF